MMRRKIKVDRTILEQIRVLNRCDRLLFENWIDVHGGQVLDKWLDNHMDEPNTFQSKEFAEYLIDSFSKYINRNT